jgi:hypothetical protein
MSYLDTMVRAAQTLVEAMLDGATSVPELPPQLPDLVQDEPLDPCWATQDIALETWRGKLAATIGSAIGRTTSSATATGCASMWLPGFGTSRSTTIFRPGLKWLALVYRSALRISVILAGGTRYQSLVAVNVVPAFKNLTVLSAGIGVLVTQLSVKDAINIVDASSAFTNSLVDFIVAPRGIGLAQPTLKQPPNDFPEQVHGG